MKMNLYIILWMILTVHISAQIRVACAANMQFTIREIIEVYTEKTGNQVQPVFSSSGKLATQIMHGAPFDVYVSADMEFVEKLYANNMAVNPPRKYAKGRLVLWSTRMEQLEVSKDFLLKNEVKTIGIGDPKVTIYGPAALQVLTQIGVLEQIQTKFVYGDNIGTVAKYIVEGNVDVGLANLSFVTFGPMAGRGAYIEIDASLYEHLPQGAAVLQYGQLNNPVESQAFFEFLYGPESRTILERHGYGLPTLKLNSEDNLRK